MKWFDYKEFSYKELVQKKKRSQLTVGLCIPTLNEENNIDRTLEVVNSCTELFDSVIVVDSGSNDKTKNICDKRGVDFYSDKSTAKSLGLKFKRGKGFNLWLSLFILKTDVVIWIDADITNLSQDYLLGLVGPFLKEKKLRFIKGYYKKVNGGGRVTELMVRPYFNLIYPSLSEVVQPLSGEFGGRRDYLSKLFFYSGFSVEVALLIQSIMLLKKNEFGQVYLGEKQHESRDIANISICSASILRSLFEILEIYKKVSMGTSNYYRYYNQDLKIQKIKLDEKMLPPIKKAVGHEALQPGGDVFEDKVQRAREVSNSGALEHSLD